MPVNIFILQLIPFLELSAVVIFVTIIVVSMQPPSNVEYGDLRKGSTFPKICAPDDKTQIHREKTIQNSNIHPYK